MYTLAADLFRNPLRMPLAHLNPARGKFLAPRCVHCLGADLPGRSALSSLNLQSLTHVSSRTHQTFSGEKRRHGEPLSFHREPFVGPKAARKMSLKQCPGLHGCSQTAHPSGKSLKKSPEQLAHSTILQSNHSAVALPESTTCASTLVILSRGRVKTMFRGSLIQEEPTGPD